MAALEKVLRYMFLMFSAPSDVLQVMFDDGIMITVLIMVLVVIGLSYGILYHVLDRPSLNRRKHLWIAIMGAAITVFIVTLLYVPSAVNAGLKKAAQESMDQAQTDNESGLGSRDGGGSIDAASSAIDTVQGITGLTTNFGMLQALPTATASFVWTVMLFGVLTLSPIPRRYSTNCRTLKII